MGTNGINSTLEEIEIDLRSSQTPPDDISSIDPPQNWKKASKIAGGGLCAKEPSPGPIISKSQTQVAPTASRPADKGAERV